MEILAPVGGKEQLIAAVRCGAGAVYLGAKGFNARRNAENFESCDLAETVRYCHSRNVKVHITLNTLVHDSELLDLYDTADEIAAAGVDAVIVQDMAVFKYLITRYPDLPLHASTQSVVHNVESAKFMKDLGYSRIVLARELTLDEIRRIRQEVDIETEVFVHGALCMSVSGACYLSCLLGGRSGNRGLCAQPCRLNFTSAGRQYALSLKDMSHLKYVKELEDAGVCSLKIEGRMKRPEYVAAAVTACKAALEGRPYDEETLRAVFSRGGFTDGYITGKRDLDMFGHREKEDVTAAAKVLKSIESTYHKENPLLAVDAKFYVNHNDKCRLDFTCLGKTVTAWGDSAIKSRDRDTDEEIARKNISKLGGTQFYLRELTVYPEKGYMVPPSVLNSMRREATDKLDLVLGAKNVYEKCQYNEKPLPPSGGGDRLEELWARFNTSEQIHDGEAYGKIILPIAEIAKNRDLIKKYGERLIGELPIVAFPEYEQRLRDTVCKLIDSGLKALYTENVYGIKLAKDMGIPVYGGAALNVLNSESARLYGESGLSAITLSFELSLAKAKDIRSPVPKGIVGYGYLPLMTVRNCPVKTPTGCSGCKNDRCLVDRRGTEFPVICRDRLYSTVLNSVPLHIADRNLSGFDYIILYFTKETKEECARVHDDYVNHRGSESPRTGGMYFRTLA